MIVAPSTPAAAAAPSANERRILILAPTGIDASLTAEFLAKAKLSPQICSHPRELCEEIAHGCGVIILGEETLADPSIQNLLSCLETQPSWSDIPIVLVTRGGEASKGQLRRLAIFGPTGNVVMLERPFRPGTLISTLEAALRARQRQYEARDFMESLKRARDEAQRASQAKDAFLAALSHELRTPLSPILLIASEYAASEDLPADVREGFETIRKNIELEARLIEDLLDLTRVTTGKLVLHRKNVNVDGILADALGTVRDGIRRKQIQLELKLNAGQGVVNGDPVRLQQVFWNILTNAVKFTPKNGTIRIESLVLPPPNRDLLVRISDSGMGLTPDESARIFQAFVQGDHASADGGRPFGGLGLGLAISRNLIQLHSGTITVESDGRNLGATFTVRLPLAGLNS